MTNKTVENTKAIFKKADIFTGVNEDISAPLKIGSNTNKKLNTDIINNYDALDDIMGSDDVKIAPIEETEFRPLTIDEFTQLMLRQAYNIPNEVFVSVIDLAKFAPKFNPAFAATLDFTQNFCAIVVKSTGALKGKLSLDQVYDYTFGNNELEKNFKEYNFELEIRYKEKYVDAGDKAQLNTVFQADESDLPDNMQSEQEMPIMGESKKRGRKAKTSKEEISEANIPAELKPTSAILQDIKEAVSSVVEASDNYDKSKDKFCPSTEFINAISTIVTELRSYFNKA